MSNQQDAAIEDKGVGSSASAGSPGLSGSEDDSRHHQWEDMQEEWKSNWESTSVDSDSRGAEITGKGKGKGKAESFPFSPTRKPSNTEKDRERQQKLNARRNRQLYLQWTMQRSPFHTSQIGKLAARKPHSIGLFRPDYPFTPSGRRRKAHISTADDADSLPPAFQYEYTTDPSIMNSNVMKHGWTAAVLDDDVNLSVPDESRRSRQTSLYNRELLGRKWYRWRPGEGWVFCRTKDLSAYRQGPGIALGQLLPPREKIVTSQLPMIPNDSKRDFVWTFIVCLLFFAVIALIREYRQQWSSKRKGKRRSRSSDNGRRSLARIRTASSTLNIRKARQRTQAQHFRDLCKFALRKSVTGVGQAASSTSTGLANIRWASNVNGTSSGLVSSSAVRRGPVQLNEDADGATIELLEKGGVDGSGIVSPIREDVHFDLHEAGSSNAECPPERSR